MSHFGSKCGSKNNFYFNKFHYLITLKYMLGNVYVNKIHAREFLYISLYYREGFSHSFNFFAVSNGILHI